MDAVSPQLMSAVVSLTRTRRLDGSKVAAHVRSLQAGFTVFVDEKGKKAQQVGVTRVALPLTRATAPLRA